MPSQKPKVQIRFEEEDYQYLEQWAKTEFSTLTHLCRILILRAIAHRKGISEPSSMLKQSHDDVDQLDAATILRLLANGKRPNDGEILVVAHESGINEEALLKLRDRLFPQNHKSTNGAS